VLFSAPAQEPVANSELLQTLLAEVTAGNEDDRDAESLLEDLAENPVHINDANIEDLSRIVWLTEFQTKSLLEHIQKRGAILSYYEIASLYGFTPELAQTLIPFTSLEKKPNISTAIPLRQAIHHGKNKIIIGAQSILESMEGYTRPDSVENRYAGSPIKASLRYSFSYAGKIYFGITAGKNAGEAFLRKNNPYGFDFHSMHFQLNTKGIVKTLTLGDFRADFGQGLVLWSRLNYGKSAMTLNSMRSNSGLNKYSSLNRTRFMRGAGIVLHHRKTDLSLFYSRKAIDATVTAKDENGHAAEVSSFPVSGYHRTPSEIAGKHAVTEQIVGANVSVNHTGLHIGATAIYYDYDATLMPIRSIYNHFAFTGRRNSNYSIDFRFRTGDVIFYGEQAVARNGALALLYGAQILIGERMIANILYRRYAKNYHAHCGMAFGENSRNTNEEGFFWGLNWNIDDLWRLSSYCDIYRLPWLSYRAGAPSSGREAMLQADCTPSPETKMYIRARYIENEENDAATAMPVISIATAKTVSAKLVFSHRIRDGLGIASHLELKNRIATQIADNGYFLAQDMYATVNTFRRYPLRITMRYAIFDTDSYDSRIYSYENDLLYAFSVPAFYDRGVRLSLMLMYELGKHIDLRCKYAATQYTDKTETGSGLNLTHGNRRSEVKMQIVYKF
jgi:hypothetical protein